MRNLALCLFALSTACGSPVAATSEPLALPVPVDAGPTDAGADCWYHERWTWPIACTFAPDGVETCVLTDAQGGAH